MKRKIMSIAMSIAIAGSLVGGFVSNSNALSALTNWKVYYVSGGGVAEHQVKGTYAYGGGYIAKCTSFKGNYASANVYINGFINSNATKGLALSKKVVFSNKGKISFKATSQAKYSKVYWGITLTHNSANEVYASGTIKTNK